MRRLGTITGGSLVALGGASIVALVVAGFVLGGYMDAAGEVLVPGFTYLARLPTPVRLVLEIAVAIPIVFGVALYFITAWIEFLLVLSWPFRKFVSIIRGS